MKKFLKPHRFKILILKNRIKRLFKRKIQNEFLFILSPPYSGSTMLNELISTSKNVSNVNPYGFREGKGLPKVKEIMKKDDRWSNKHPLPWKEIKSEWLKYWDVTKPVLLEKTPMNIMYGKEISEEFIPARFIVFYRNPYALCETLMRRKKMSATEAATFVVTCFRYQKFNLEVIPNLLHFSYEALSETPDKIIGRLVTFMPALGQLDHNIEYNAHNQFNKPMPLENMNQHNINRLSAQDMNHINTVFVQNSALLLEFGYQLQNLTD